MRVKLFKNKRRAEVRAQPFPDEWDVILRENFPIYLRLPDEDREELRGHINVFLEEKRFEGCGDLELTDEIRVTIAAQACLLLLHRETEYFPEMQSIFVYPTLFYTDVTEEDEFGIVSEYEEDRSGEAWEYGPVVLSWEDALTGARGEEGGYNTVIHEFVHRLDLENGAPDGVPRLETKEQYQLWERTMSEAFEKFERKLDTGRATILDEYGAEGPDEFFAVAAEHFFQTPLELRREYPRLYGVLKDYFKQDPASWPGM
ncbi:MAG: zinc-dependent peptidase [Candidatus Latescibacterota bacterium]